jgi:hypothetical protein
MINVSGDLCEQINVITPCDTSKGSRVADLQLVVSPVLEHYGIHRIIFEVMDVGVSPAAKLICNRANQDSRASVLVETDAR